MIELKIKRIERHRFLTPFSEDYLKKEYPNVEQVINDDLVFGEWRIIYDRT